MSLLQAIANGVWLTLPSLVPNSGAVLFGGGTPIDFGRTWRGKRILGDGKTWRGFIGGTLLGILVGLAQLYAASFYDSVNYFGFGPYPSCVGIVILLAVGSLLGDMGGSFIKRRLDIGRGRKAPLLDQYTFLIGSFLLVLLFNPDWFIAHFIEGENILALITIIVVTPILHRTVNIIGYKVGKKQVPW